MKRERNSRSFFLALVSLLGLTSGAEAALVDAGPGSFTPLAPVITFEEVALGTVNPVYNFNVPSLGGPVTITFGGNFVGQAAGGGFPVTLTDHTPTGPLALDSGAPNTSTVNDGSSTTSPVTRGGPVFNGPISVLFSVPVAGVGLKGGFFNAVHSTTIEAYDASGNILGAITNTVTGFEFYGLKDSSGANVISGISFFITGDEPFGFEIDNLTFGGATELVLTPEPGSFGILGIGLIGAFALRRLRHR